MTEVHQQEQPNQKPNQKQQTETKQLLPHSDFQFIPLNNNQIKISVGKEAIIIKCGNNREILDNLASTVNNISPKNLNELFKSKDFQKFFNDHKLQASEIEFKIGKEAITFKCKQNLLRNLQELIAKVDPQDLKSLFNNHHFINFSKRHTLQISSVKNTQFHGSFFSLGHVSFSSDIQFDNCLFNHDTHLMLPLVKNASFTNCHFDKNSSVKINNPSAKVNFNGCKFLPYKDISHPIQGRMEGFRVYGILSKVNISHSEGSINITENNCELKHRLYIDTQTTKFTGGEITTKYLRDDYISCKINEAHDRDNKILAKMQSTLTDLEDKYLQKTKELQTTSRGRLLKRDNLKDELGVLECQMITLKNKMLLYEAYSQLNDLSSTAKFKEVTDIKISDDKVSYTYNGNNHIISLRKRFIVPKEEKFLKQPIIHRDSSSMINSLMTSIPKLREKPQCNNNKPLDEEMVKIFHKLYDKRGSILASGKQHHKELRAYFKKFKRHHPSLYDAYKNEIETFLKDCKKYTPPKKQGK